jgi:hypothetical protein
MNVHIKHCQDRIWIALHPIRLYGSPNFRLRQHKVSEFVWIYQCRVSLEELVDKFFDGMVVHIRVGIEEIKVDVDEALLGWLDMVNRELERRESVTHDIRARV